jgi:hypothetical protein
VQSFYFIFWILQINTIESSDNVYSKAKRLVLANMRKKQSVRQLQTFFQILVFYIL